MAEQGHTGVSFWLDNAPFQSADDRTTKELPNTANVVIIGAGITGLSIAHWLQRFGTHGLVVVEQGGVASGATGRNGGLLFPEDCDYNQNRSALYGGVDVARCRAEFERNTIDDMLELCKEDGIEGEVDLHLGGAMCFYESERAAGYERSAVQQADGSEVFPQSFVEPADLQRRFHTAPDKCSGALRIDFGGQWAPAKFCFALARRIVKRGANLQLQTTVTSVRDCKESGFAKEVSTNRGSICCSAVVYATNAWTLDILPELRTVLPVQPAAGEMIATQPVTRLDDDSAEFKIDECIEFLGSRYGHMIHRPSDGRILYGGPDGSEDFIKRLFPKISKQIKVDYRWQGHMAFTSDKSPLIGPVPTAAALCKSTGPTSDGSSSRSSYFRNSEYIAAAFHGNGMPQCFGAAKLLAEFITGRRTLEDIPPWFRSDRFLKMKMQREAAARSYHVSALDASYTNSAQSRTKSRKHIVRIDKRKEQKS